MFGAVAFGARPFGAARGLFVTVGGISAASIATLASIAGTATATVAVSSLSSATLAGITGSAAAAIAVKSLSVATLTGITGTATAIVGTLTPRNPSTARTLLDFGNGALAGGTDRTVYTFSRSTLGAP